MTTQQDEHKEPDYEKAELELLRDALKRTHEDKSHAEKRESCS